MGACLRASCFAMGEWSDLLCRERDVRSPVSRRIVKTKSLSSCAVCQTDRSS
jgi:hypothetical protein